MNNKRIPFKEKNIAYIVGWTDFKSYEGEGYTLVKNLKNLAGNILWRLDKTDFVWLYQEPPIIRQFEDLNNLLEGKNQKWVRWQIDLPKNRELDENELKIMYQKLKRDITDFFPPIEQVEKILPMFYKK